VKASIAAVGVVVLLIGLGIWAFAAYSPIPSSTATTTSTVTAIPAASRDIDGGGTWSAGVNLKGGETVTGTATIQNFNKSAGPVFFYLMNESIFIDWGGCSPCTEPSAAVGHLAAGSFQNNTMPSTGTLSFTYTPPTTGGYYVVFDDEVYGSSAQASISANGAVSTTMTTNSPYASGYLPLVGAAIAVVGIIIAALSLMMKGKPKTTSQTMSPSSTSPYQKATSFPAQSP
jgi:hypothetical protein